MQVVGAVVDEVEARSGRTIRLGLVGLGNWGYRLAGCIDATPRAELAACYARDPERRAAFAEKTGSTPAASLDALLGDPEIDGVLVATPHSTHAALVCEVAAAGKHVLVEKPMTLTVPEARRCIDAAETAGVLLQVNHFRRRAPATRALGRMLDDGTLGTAHQVEAYFSRPVGQAPMRGWRNDPGEAPAGGMTALGVHMVDNLLFLAGPVARLTAMSKKTLGRGAIDDVTGILLEYEAGPLGYLGTCLVVPKVAVTTVLGSEGAGWSEEDGTRLFRQGRNEESRTEERVAGADEDPVRSSVAAFVESVRTGARPETGGREGLEIVAVLEAVTESAAHGGAPVDLTEVRSRR